MLNIHPAIVHTPVGLLTIYSLLEFLRFKKLLARPYWFYIKATLVIVGFGGAIAAYLTGDLLEDAFRGDALVEMHSNFALATSILYGIIAAGYLVLWFQKEWGDLAFLKNKNIAKIWQLKLFCANFLQKTWVAVPLSLLAFVCIFITGTLGGAIAYGP